MLDLSQKRLAVAGKLVGRYASRQRELVGRLAQLDAVLVDGLADDPDVVVMAAKSKGFVKRVEKKGLPTITEAELENAVEHVFDRVRTPTPHRVRRSDFVDSLVACTQDEPSPVALRRNLLAALIKATEGGYDVGLGPSLPAERLGALPQEPQQVVARQLLVWASQAGCRMFVLETELDGAALDDIRRLAGATVYFGEDCALATLGAAVRTLVRMGEKPARLWEQLEGELENRDADAAETGVSSAEALRLPTTLAAMQLSAADEFNFAVSRVFVVTDQLND